MRCPYCQADDDRVIDSRSAEDGMAIKRRRECSSCAKRFTTFERIEGEQILRVVKKDGSHEMFDRGKLLQGMISACQKRPVATEVLEAAVDRIHRTLIAEGERETTSQRIGHLVMAELHKLDQVAYVRFASVYREFKDLDEFMGELRRVIAGGKA